MEELNKQVEKAYKELDDNVDEYNTRHRDNAQVMNESPCTICGKKAFVLKYRDVNGKIEGRISGSFSLFGGSISGYVDGETHTDPILSCRECENERKIIIPNTRSITEVWEQQLPYMSTSGSLKPDQDKVSEWLQQYGLEVACELDRKIRSWKDYQQFYKYSDDKYPRFSLTEFSYLGLEPKYGAVGYIRPYKKVSQMTVLMLIFLATMAVVCIFLALLTGNY